MALRDAIRTALVAGVPAIGQRWYEPHAASADSIKPFGILRISEGDAGNDWGAASQFVEAWPYVSRDSFSALDGLVAQIIATLDNARLTDNGVPYLVQHDVTGGRDFIEEAWDAITRPVRFRVYALNFLTGTTYSPDPVAALTAWTVATWPGQAQTDPATWNPQDATPAVYWRMVRLAQERAAYWGAWLNADFRAHAIAPSATVRATWARRLVEGMALHPFKQLTMSDGGPLLFREVSADTEADPFGTGQVLLAARFAILIPAPVSPPPPIVPEVTHSLPI